MDDAQRTIQRRLKDGMNEGLQGLEADVRLSALSRLPHRGGLAARVAASSFSTGQTVDTVTFNMTNPYHLNKIDEGQLRHPVYGNRNVWVFQPVSPGFWSGPVDRRTEVVQRDIVKVMDAIGREIEG
jgi:hypothetical protein